MTPLAHQPQQSGLQSGVHLSPTTAIKATYVYWRSRTQKKKFQKPRRRAHPFSFVSDASQISCGAASPLGPSASGRPDRRSCSDLNTRVVRLTAVLLPLASRQGTPQIPNLQLTIKS